MTRTDHQPHMHLVVIGDGSSLMRIERAGDFVRIVCPYCEGSSEWTLTEPDAMSHSYTEHENDCEFMLALDRHRAAPQN